MNLPRASLAFLPTPIHRLDRVSEHLGHDVWIKRDDLTGLALGGNKTRKLEYLVGDALSSGATAIVTCGAIQSNFIRQLGAACARYGLRCAAAVMDLPYEDEVPTGQRLGASEGNPKLDALFGVDLRVGPDGPWEELYRQAEDLAQEMEALGEKTYRIPIGGSSPLGAFAFYEAAQELQRQAAPFDWIVTASSSGSTQTGLAYGFRESGTHVLGISSDPEPEIAHDFHRLGLELSALIGVPPLPLEQFDVDCGFVGPGYGLPSDEGNRAIRFLARLEGILLDPVYSGKAFAALLSLTRDGKIGGRILFWHTGGAPTLFAMPGTQPFWFEKEHRTSTVTYED
ncbi:MAG TPA: D-cysteine desulfhydrase family protein [Fimbriimonas sp.]|nr:D-cysteine desulfhydrase family protein [Fimbriimonas sp.]